MLRLWKRPWNPRADWGSIVFVGSLWAILSVALFHFVRSYGLDFPWRDEWENALALAGAEPMTLKWLWSQHNEHRIFLGRFLYIALNRLARGDFRAIMYFDASLLCGAAAALVLAARRARGETRYSDAFFPAVLLHWGQAENLYWGFQVSFVGATAVVLLALVVAARTRLLGARDVVMLAGCALALPLFGGNGLPFAPPIALAAAVAGWDLAKRARARLWWVVTAWGVSALALGLCGFYFVGYVAAPSAHPAVGEAVPLVFDLLVLGLGHGAVDLTLPNGRVVPALVLIAALVLLGAIVLFDARERSRALRLGFFVGAGVVLASGIAWSRAVLGHEQAVTDRYATLIAPFWCTIYFVAMVARRPRLAEGVQSFLFFASLTVLSANMAEGASSGRRLLAWQGPISEEVHAGGSAGQIVAKYHDRMYPAPPAWILERVRALRDHGVGTFARLRD